MSATPQATRRTYHDLTDELVAQGVRTVFGLMGEDGAALVTDLVDRGGIRYIGARHENAAVNMADGYAWATGALGVAIISRGPGLTNAVTSLETAGRSNNRTLVIVGDAPSGALSGRSDLKVFNSKDMLASVRASVRHVSGTETPVNVLKSAIADAKEGKLAIYLVPADSLTRECELRRTHGEPLRRLATGPTGPVARTLARTNVERAAELLSVAKRPLVVAGAGAVSAGAKDLIVEIADCVGGALGTSLLAKDLFRGHPYDIGVLGGFATDAAREIAASADCALVFGASLNSFTTARGRLFGDLRLVRVDHDPAALAAGLQAEVELIGDCRATAIALLESFGASGRIGPGMRTPELADRIATAPRISLAEPKPRVGVLDPRVLSVELDRMLPADRTVVVDAGHSLGFGAQYFRVQGPGHFRMTSQFGAIGMSLGTALGVAEARSASQVVLCVGDGSLLMTLGELETAARSGIPLLIVVYNDQAYGAERHFLDMAGMPNHMSMFPDVDFAAVAKGLGIRSATIRAVEALHQIELGSRLDGPMLLDCKIDPAFRSRWFDELAG
jgi:thiamine pyrophosphate-dependent acetolactate synthase large subunit-like protein